MIDLFGNKLKVKSKKKVRSKSSGITEFKNKLTIVNSLSGGPSSSYVAAHYPADIDIFALCCIDDHNAGKKIDPSIKRMVNDRLQKYCADQNEFVATSEDPKTLNVIFDLEQLIGREITWVRGLGWEQMMEVKKALPNIDKRFCTTIMKLIPTFEFLFKHTDFPVKMRIGYRYDEKERKDSFDEYFKYPTRCNIYDSREEIINETKNHIIASNAIELPNTGQYFYHSHETFHWRIGDFPMIDHKITHPRVRAYFEDKGIFFPEDSNCQNCFWKDAAQLRKNFDTNPDIMNWAAVHEAIRNHTFKEDNSLLEIKRMGIQQGFFFGTGSGCQSSGFCTS